MTGLNVATITPTADEWTVTATFTPEAADNANPSVAETRDASSAYWTDFWKKAVWSTSAIAPTRAPRNSNAV